MNYETPTTELEAVNVLLESIGELPVNTIEASGVGGSSMALNMIRRVSRQVQGKGLFCNTEVDYPLTPNGASEISLPTTILDIRMDDTLNRYTMRGERLYDITNHTYVITEADITASFMRILLPFIDLPEYVRDYVTIKAGREFQANRLGDGEHFNFTKEDEYRAYSHMLAREKENYAANVALDPELSNIIKRISKEIQTEGLYCNTENEYPLVPDVNNEITLPVNTLNVTITQGLGEYTLRGNKLYDITNHTFTITESDLLATVEVLLPFADLPDYAQEYITIRATREHQANMLELNDLYETSSMDQSTYTKNDEDMALFRLKRKEDENYDYNIFDATPLINLKGGMYRRP